METKFPAGAFLVCLFVGFLCLFAALSIRPNYRAMQSYQNDPAYVVTSHAFLRFQTLSNAIAAGNPKTLSQLEALAHAFVAKPTPGSHVVKHRKTDNH